MEIRINNLTKQYGLQPAINQVNLALPSGELTALLGPSGCGKTTLLRTLAGLEHAQQGQIWFGSQLATGLTVQARRAGFVFQNYALFRHLTVFDNVAFGLDIRKGAKRLSRAAIRERVMQLLERVQLANLAQRKPDQLSGGQRQRVALARALAIDPQVLLLDEPFGALDAQVRRHLRQWLRQLHDDLKLTTILVTHDQEEALEIADQVVIMNQGRIEQIGTPRDVYDHPVSAFVMDFLGQAQPLQDAQIRTGLPQYGNQQNLPQVYLRPDEVSLSSPATANRHQGWLARVDRLGWLSGRVEVLLTDSQHLPLQALLSTAQAGEWQVGQQVWVQPERIHVFDAQTGQRMPMQLMSRVA